MLRHETGLKHCTHINKSVNVSVVQKSMKKIDLGRCTVSISLVVTGYGNLLVCYIINTPLKEIGLCQYDTIIFRLGALHISCLCIVLVNSSC
jgi:hypothetical protein